MTSHSRCVKDSASCDTKFCLLHEHRVLANVLLKNFVAAAVFSVSYFLNVVKEFRSCLSKPEGSVCHFGRSIGRAVMTSLLVAQSILPRATQNSVFFANIEHRVLADVLLKNFVAAADVLLKNFVAAAVFSVSYFSMLLKNFVAAYQSLREACAISGPCTSTRTCFTHCPECVIASWDALVFLLDA